METRDSRLRRIKDKKEVSVLIIGAGINGDEHVILLSIHAYPCRYIPASNELLYTNEMNIKVSYELPEKPLLQNDEYDLVIIAPSEFSDALQPLVQHKENHGLKTKLTTLNEIYGGTHFTIQIPVSNTQ